MSSKVEFNLISNATDSIEHAVDLLAYNHELNRATISKRAIMSIAHAIELLLKERLRIVHPSLIWENVDRYPDLDARTVSAEGALVRLKRIGGLEFSAEDEQLLRAIRKMRNAIEHFKCSISIEEADHIIGTSLSFAVKFLKIHLGTDLLGYAERESGILQDLMDRNSSFAKSFKVVQPNNEGATKLCSFCKALLFIEDRGVCSRCGHWNYLLFEASGDADDDIPF